MATIKEQTEKTEQLKTSLDNKVDSIGNIINTKVKEKPTTLTQVEDVLNRKMLGIGDVNNINCIKNVTVKESLVFSIKNIENAEFYSSDFKKNVYYISGTILTKVDEDGSIIFRKDIKSEIEEFDTLTITKILHASNKIAISANCTKGSSKNICVLLLNENGDFEKKLMNKDFGNDAITIYSYKSRIIAFYKSGSSMYTTECIDIETGSIVYTINTEKKLIGVYTYEKKALLIYPGEEIITVDDKQIVARESATNLIYETHVSNSFAEMYDDTDVMFIQAIHRRDWTEFKARAYKGEGSFDMTQSSSSYWSVSFITSYKDYETITLLTEPASTPAKFIKVVYSLESKKAISSEAIKPADFDKTINDKNAFFQEYCICFKKLEDDGTYTLNVYKKGFKGYEILKIH